jgi:peroxiredoxin Q/BCP
VLSHQAFRDEHGLTISLLADTEEEVCRLYDVIQQKVVDGHPKSYLMRSTFVIDKKGVVRHILRDVNPKAHVNEVLKIVRNLDNVHAN